MIVYPNRGVFFVGTALIYAASLYGAEAFSATDPLTRIFVGEPTQLTLPPVSPETTIAEPTPFNECAPQLSGTSVPGGQNVTNPGSEVPSCAPHAAERAPSVEPALPIGATNAKGALLAQPASPASTVERP